MKLSAFHISRRMAASVIAWMLAIAVLPAALAQPVLYGGLGGHGVTVGPQASTNDGSLVIVSQTDGSTTVVGHPAGVARISGIAFGLDGVLYGATQVGGGFPPPPGPNAPSELIRIDPDTGALLSSVTIKDGAEGISIADLAVHPKTGALYGVRSSHDPGVGEGKLYIINPATGAATFVGDTFAFFASIAFAPDGTLYMGVAELGAGPVNPGLLTLNAGNGAILKSVSTAHFYSSLAVRPSDGVMFGGTGDLQGVYTIDRETGAATGVGLTGRNLVGGLAFRPTQAPVVAAIEYRHAEWDHYFATANPDEITKLDNGTFVGWARTGQSFNVYPLNTANAFDVCRFFSTSFAPRSSHFYTPFASECAVVKQNPNWQFEGLVFSVGLPDAAANCAAGTQALYRLYNNGQGAAPNHRYTTSLATRSTMLGQGWISEGTGDLGVIACVPT